MIMANGQSFTLSMFSATSIGLGDIVPGFRIKANYDQDNISRESATQITLVWFYLVYISLGEFDQNTLHSLGRGGREGEGWFTFRVFTCLRTDRWAEIAGRRESPRPSSRLKGAISLFLGHFHAFPGQP